MAKVKLDNINKVYPNGVQAVFDFNLDIKDGEFVVLVGPSGCGKSTTLRMIAGLEGITSGEFLIDDVLSNSLAPVDRDIAMVFQNYALYSHMTVYDNMGISLKLRHEDKLEIHDLVKETANKLELTDYLNRLTTNLSGGQRQRVALGRTVIRNPKVFLMDEPLSNLDAKLREKTRSEIVTLQKELGVTTIYVTHDQIEAMTMADRIVVMKDGYIQQTDTPYNIYTYPSNLFVAGFIGTPTMNFIDGQIKGNYFITKKYKFEIPSKKFTDISSLDGKEVTLGIRPEHILCDELYLKKHKEEVLELEIDYTEFLGNKYEARLVFEHQFVVGKFDSRDLVTQGSMKVVFNMEKSHFFDKDTTNRISEV